MIRIGVDRRKCIFENPIVRNQVDRNNGGFRHDRVRASFTSLFGTDFFCHCFLFASRLTTPKTTKKTLRKIGRSTHTEIVEPCHAKPRGNKQHKRHPEREAPQNHDAEQHDEEKDKDTRQNQTKPSMEILIGIHRSLDSVLLQIYDLFQRAHSLAFDIHINIAITGKGSTAVLMPRHRPHDRRILHTFINIPDECPTCHVRRGEVADRNLDILPRPLVDRRHLTRKARFAKRRLDIDIVFLLRDKREQRPSGFIQIFTDQLLRRIDQRHRDRHHPVVAGFAGNIFNAAPDDIGIGHFVKVAHPAADHALKDKDITLRLQLLVIPHVRLGQLFPLLGRNIDRGAVNDLRNLILLERIIGGESAVIQPDIERPQSNQHIRNVVHTALLRSSRNHQLARSIKVRSTLQRQIRPHFRPRIRDFVVQLRMLVEDLGLFHQERSEIIERHWRDGMYIQDKTAARQSAIQFIALQCPHQHLEMFDPRLGEFVNGKVLLRQREKVAFLLLNGIGCLRAQRPTNQLFKPLPRNGRFIIGCLNRMLDHVDQLFQFRTLGQQSVPLLARDIRNVDAVLLPQRLRSIQMPDGTRTRNSRET